MKEDDDGMFLTEDRMSIGLNPWKTPTSHPLNSSQSHKSCPPEPENFLPDTYQDYRRHPAYSHI